jgi:hypothetical protein
MTFDEFKKIVEEEFVEVEQELKEHPTPRINDNDCVPDYAYEYGQNLGKKDTLAWVLGKIEQVTFKKKKKHG